MSLLLAATSGSQVLLRSTDAATSGQNGLASVLFNFISTDASSSGQNGTTNLGQAIIGTNASNSGQSGFVTLAQVLAGIDPSTSGQSALAQLAQLLIGTDAGAAGQAGLVSLSQALSALAAGTGNATGQTGITSKLVGAASGTGSQLSKLNILLALASESLAQSDQSAVLGRQVILEGTSDSISEETGNLEILTFVFLSGTADAAADSVAEILMSIGLLTSPILGTSSAIGNLEVFNLDDLLGVLMLIDPAFVTELEATPANTQTYVFIKKVVKAIFYVAIAAVDNVLSCQVKTGDGINCNDVFNVCVRTISDVPSTITVTQGTAIAGAGTTTCWLQTTGFGTFQLEITGTGDVLVEMVSKQGLLMSVPLSL
jgi:hypothetical protein